MLGRRRRVDFRFTWPTSPCMSAFREVLLFSALVRYPITGVAAATVAHVGIGSGLASRYVSAQNIQTCYMAAGSSTCPQFSPSADRPERAAPSLSLFQTVNVASYGVPVVLFALGVTKHSASSCSSLFTAILLRVKAPYSRRGRLLQPLGLGGECVYRSAGGRQLLTATGRCVALP